MQTGKKRHLCFLKRGNGDVFFGAVLRSIPITKGKL